MNGKSRRLTVAGLLLTALALPGVVAARADELHDRSAVRVCADENLLPVTDRALDGFGNKIAALIGQDLKLPVEYTWWPETVGFLAHTLKARACDLVLTTAEGNTELQPTNPYYRSIYALVYRTDSGLKPAKLNDPQFRTLRIGVVIGTPAATLLAKRGISNIEPYQLNTDTRVHMPARDAVEDVAKGLTDAAVIWGPIAGYWAARQSVPMTVVPLVDEADAGVRLDFRVTMGVREEEPEWKHFLNDFITRHQDEITKLLVDDHVPLLDAQGKLITPAVQQTGTPKAGAAPVP